MSTNIDPIEETIGHHIIPMVYDDALSQLEMIGAIQDKINLLIANNNDYSAQLQSFKAWVDTKIADEASKVIADIISQGEFDALIQNLWQTFRTEVEATITTATNATTQAIAELDAAEQAIAAATQANAQAITNATNANAQAIATATENNAELVAASNATNASNIVTAFADRFQGFTRIIVSDTEPTNSQNGDLWIRIGAAIAKDTTPPAPVTAFEITVGSGQLLLGWINPSDADFLGVKIVRKTGSYPNSITDGTVVYTGAGVGYQDILLADGTPYYYAIYAFDTSNNYSTPVTKSATPTTAPSDIFTNDYAAGSTDVSTNIGVALSGAASGVVSSSRLNFNSPAVADAYVYYIKPAITWLSRRVRFKGKTTPLTGSTISMLSLIQRSTTPSTGNIAMVNGEACINVYQNSAGAIYCMRVNPARDHAYSLKSDGTWTLDGSDIAVAGTIGTDYIVDYEFGASGVRVIIRNAAGTALVTSGWVAKASLPDNAQAYYMRGGDPYIDYYGGSLVIAELSVAVGA